MWELIMDGWTWLVENEDLVRRLCVRSARDRKDFIEEMWAVAVDRVQRAYELWVEELSPLQGHMYRTLKWYMWKRYVKLHELEQECLQLDYAGNIASRQRSASENLEVKDQVYCILQKLDEYDRRLLVMHHVMELNFAEMGDALGMSKSCARVHYLKALEKAKAFR